MNRQLVEKYWVLDLDRCLGSDALYTDAYEAAGQIDNSLEQELRRVQAQVEIEGGSFDIVNYLGTMDGSLQDDFLAAYQELTHSRGPERYRAVGTRALLHYLDSAGNSGEWMTMTYGGEMWQAAKLEAAGLLNQPYRIIKVKEKARIINGWYDADSKRFSIPGENIVAETVCLVDDKAVAFKGLHSKAEGFWVHNSTNDQPSQRGRVSKRIVEVSSLEEIVEYQKQQLATT